MFIQKIVFGIFLTELTTCSKLPFSWLGTLHLQEKFSSILFIEMSKS